MLVWMYVLVCLCWCVRSGGLLLVFEEMADASVCGQFTSRVRWESTTDSHVGVC